MSRSGGPACSQQQLPLQWVPPPYFVPSQSPCLPHCPFFPCPSPFPSFPSDPACCRTSNFSAKPHQTPSPSACFNPINWPWIVPLSCGCRPYLIPCTGPPCPPCNCLFNVSPSLSVTAPVSSSRSFTGPASEMERSGYTPDADNKLWGQNVPCESQQVRASSDHFNDLQDGYNEGEGDVEEEEPQFVLSDEWAEFFAKSEARRKEKKAQLKKAKQAAKHKLRPSPQQEDELLVPTLPENVRFSDGIGEP